MPDASDSGKNVIIFGVDMSSSVLIDNKEKDVLILGKGETDGLDNSTLTAEKECSINFTEQQKKFYSNLPYNGSKDFETKLCLGDVSKDFSVDIMKRLD